MRLITLFFALALMSLSALAQMDPQKCAEASTPTGINLDILETCLGGEGVLMEVHGAVPMGSLFVVTYRNPKNFFQSVNLSLIGGTRATRELIGTLKRHDFVLVKGNYADIRAPQKHILALKLDLVSRSAEAPASFEHDYQAVPADLLAMNHFIGKVHAVYGDGSILVVEYKDLVVPVYVQPEYVALTENLSRGDKVELSYVIQERPNQPVHLNLDPAHAAPFKVLHQVTSDHGKQVTLTGKLIRFPASPQIIFPVFAINVDMGDGIFLDHTILSFTDPDLFRAARELFQASWDRHPQGVRNFRNKFINDEITVTVSGTYNMIDPLQANPQVVIDKISDIQFEEN